MPPRQGGLARVHVIALVESLEHVCCRYRLRAFADGLAAHGHTLEFQTLPQKWARWRIGAGMGHADLVILQRKLLSRWQLALLRQRVKRLAFDFDDAVFQRDSYHRKGPDCPTLRPRFHATMRAADMVVAGNRWLAETAIEVGARTVHIIPTCVDTSKYAPSKHRNAGALTMVWVGTASTLQGLERARPLLEHLGRSIPGLTLRLVSDAFLEFQFLRVEPVRWSEQNEAEAIATADVGLSLLPDDDWSRGKCGLKVLQYLAAGLPVIGNPIGVTEELIGSRESGIGNREDAAGFLADSPEQWVAALERLRDPELRRQMGAAGRRRVEERYDISVGIAGWLKLLSAAMTSARRAS